MERSTKMVTKYIRRTLQLAISQIAVDPNRPLYSSRGRTLRFFIIYLDSVSIQSLSRLSEAHGEEQAARHI